MGKKIATKKYIRKDAFIEYLKECIAPEEEIYDRTPDPYTLGKIRGYKDILGDIENDLI